MIVYQRIIKPPSINKENLQNEKNILKYRDILKEKAQNNFNFAIVL